MKKICYFIFLLFAKLSIAQIADSSIREIKLEGAVNFRDIGGYRTNNGQMVKFGILYRSAALNNLTENDLSRLEKLHIKYDFDFRGPFEVKSAPDKIPQNTIRISLPAGSENIGDSSYNRNISKFLRSDSFMLSFYTNIAPFKDRYSPLFDTLLANNSSKPILFHCTAGKDRTGIAAALILYALGVDEETIISDYEATNYYRRNENVKSILGMVKLYQLNQYQAQNLLEAKREYITATFNSIKNQYGSIEKYLSIVFGLNKDKLDKLRSIYLK